MHLPLQCREHQTHRLGRSSAGGNLGEGGGPRPAEILMGQIQDLLVIGIGMDRGHETMANPKVLHDHLRDGRKTVGSAGRIADDRVLVRVVHLFVDAKYDRDIRILRRR